MLWMVTSFDINIAILPTAPAAELVPDVLFCIPLGSPSEEERGVLTTEQPKISRHFPRLTKQLSSGIKCWMTSKQNMRIVLQKGIVTRQCDIFVSCFCIMRFSIYLRIVLFGIDICYLVSNLPFSTIILFVV